MNNDTRIHAQRLPRYSVAFAPTIRMLKLDVSIYEDGTTGKWSTPIVSGVIVTCDIWQKRVPAKSFPTLPSPSVREIRRDGWHYGGRDEEIRWLYYDESGPYWDCNDGEDHCVNSNSIVVACPWPQTDDERRLAPLFNQLLQDLAVRLQGDPRYANSSSHVISPAPLEESTVQVFQ
jgi:hypothetical protein